MRAATIRPLTIVAALLFCIGVSAGVAAARADEDTQRIAVFDFELNDTSLEGEMRGVDAKETLRLRMISNLLRQLIDDQGSQVIVDTKPLRSRLETMSALYSCNGCEVELAAELGADRAVTGYILKISTLILYIVVSLRDVKSGELIAQESVSIRGNTDESWSHGLRYLVSNRLSARMAGR